MKEDVFMNALAATARIACCASLVGIMACSEKSDDSATATTDTAPPAAEPESPASIAPDEVNFDNCMEAIDNAFVDAEVDHAPLLECCLLTTEEVGYEDLYNNPDYAALNENCCSLIAEQGEFSSACTPWGPPTPPAMPSKEFLHA